MQDMTTSTHWARIYMSGPIEQARHVIRGIALPGGLCVTIEPTLFIYAGGEEQGFVVGLVNYPRFPESPEAIDARALELLHQLLRQCYQHSAMLMTPSTTRWVSVREDVTGR